MVSERRFEIPSGIFEMVKSCKVKATTRMIPTSSKTQREMSDFLVFGVFGKTAKFQIVFPYGN